MSALMNATWAGRLALKDERDFVGRKAMVSKRKQSKDDNTAMKQVGSIANHARRIT